MRTLLFLILATTTLVAQDNEFHLDKKYDISTTGTIHLSTDDADVFIVGSNRKDIHIKIDRIIESKGIHWGDKGFDVSVELEGGNIIIRDREWGSHSMVGYMREEYVVRIEAPATMQLDIKGDDGDYEISYMAGNLKLVADDGDILIKNYEGTSVYFDLDDGDVVMSGGSGKLTVNMDDGDMDITNGNFSVIDMDIDDGDVTIETYLDDGDYEFRIEDGQLNITVLGGGGEFDIRYDDGHVRYDSSFSLIREDDDFSLLRLRGGNAKVKVRGDDTSVNLRVDD